MRHSPWKELGLGWAAWDCPNGHQRLADALQRWRLVGPSARAVLEALVLEGRQPVGAPREQLQAARFIHGEDAGPFAPLYAGAAVVGLEVARRRMTAAQAAALLDWYRRGELRVTERYVQFFRDRPHGTLAVFGALDRAGLVDRQVHRRLYRSTVLGWAVAWLLDDAAVLELAGKGAA